MIYLDHAATTPVPKAVADAMYTVLTEQYANPNAQYPFGQEMRRSVEDWRAVIAKAVGCEANQLFFTSCGTEADNWALKGSMRRWAAKGKKHLIIGNHDRDWVKKCNLEDFFESVNNLHFISDGKRQMTLCHYPMMSWPHMTRCYMVFGHIHGNTDADYWPLIRENDLMLNAGADVNGFAPVTFEEMQENNYRHKAGWNPELCTMEADQ
mgnify:CR=1 FL=1